MVVDGVPIKRGALFGTMLSFINVIRATITLVSEDYSVKHLKCAESLIVESLRSSEVRKKT